MTETPKPPPEEDLPEDGEPVSDEELGRLEDLGAQDVEFLDADKADEDDTVDNEEDEEQPFVPEELPEGATAADYATELRDGGEETPPVQRGQREG